MLSPAFTLHWENEWGGHLVLDYCPLSQLGPGRLRVWESGNWNLHTDFGNHQLNILGEVMFSLQTSIPHLCDNIGGGKGLYYEGLVRIEKMKHLRPCLV